MLFIKCKVTLSSLSNLSTISSTNMMASPTASKGRLRILFTTARIRARERSNSFSQVCTRRRYSLSFSIRVCFSCHSFSASLSN
ncbi:Uncharacterised protein [Vibrio cholerae]|nr:Uncharacterised protein [Vibrio cholerae]